MRPPIEPGDWLLIDPTTVRWPRRGSVVVFREPDSDSLAVKRVAAGQGDRVAFAQGYLELADDEAWLVSDASPEETAARGFGDPIDSRGYGPVPLELLVGRAWFRYAPLRRIGRIAGPASLPEGGERSSRSRREDLAGPNPGRGHMGRATSSDAPEDTVNGPDAPPAGSRRTHVQPAGVYRGDGSWRTA